MILVLSPSARLIIYGCIRNFSTEGKFEQKFQKSTHCVYKYTLLNINEKATTNCVKRKKKNLGKYLLHDQTFAEH